MGALFKTADAGKEFVLTEEGYKRSLKSNNKKMIQERSIGVPIKYFEEKVPVSWLKNGWVREVNKTTVSEKEGAAADDLKEKGDEKKSVLLKLEQNKEKVKQDSQQSDNDKVVQKEVERE